jgi:hypothetical protein
MPNTNVLPEKLGEVEIIETMDVLQPRRHSNKIFFPTNLVKRVVPLNDETALAQLSQRGVGRYVFFGMDESSFLTGITKTAFEIGQQKGADAFFDSLIPLFIKLLNQKIGHPIKRQGDMFAVKVGASWAEAHETLAGLQNITTADKVRTRQSVDVFQTRHVFTGNIQSCNAVTMKPKRLKMKKRHVSNMYASKTHFYLVSGVLNAPDHNTLELQDGIFCLMSGVNIASEKMRMRD